MILLSISMGLCHCLLLNFVIAVIKYLLHAVLRGPHLFSDSLQRTIFPPNRWSREFSVVSTRVDRLSQNCRLRLLNKVCMVSQPFSVIEAPVSFFLLLFCLFALYLCITC